MAQELKLPYLEVSSRTPSLIQEAFATLIQAMYLPRIVSKKICPELEKYLEIYLKLFVSRAFFPAIKPSAQEAIQHNTYALLIQNLSEIHHIDELILFYKKTVELIQQSTREPFSKMLHQSLALIRQELPYIKQFDLNAINDPAQSLSFLN